MFGETGRPGGRLSIKDQLCVSTVDYRALICREQTSDLEPLLVDERLGACDGERRGDRETDTGRERVGATVPTKSILLDFSSGHSSLSAIVLLGDWLLAAKL